MKYIVLLLFLLPLSLLSQGPFAPDPILDGLDDIRDENIYLSFPPEFLTNSPLLGNCPETHQVTFQYPRGLRLTEIEGYIDSAFPNSNIRVSFTLGQDILNCRGTNEPYGLTTGYVCQLNLPSTFITSVRNNQRLSGFGPNYSNHVPDRRFKLTMKFANHPPVERTYEMIIPEEEGESIIIQDWADCTVIENNVIVKGAIAGSLEDNCFAVCGETNHICSPKTITGTAAKGSGWAVGGGLSAKMIGVHGEYQQFNETGAEISITLPEVRISADEGEICVPLYDVTVDILESNAYQYDPGTCSRVFLGVNRMIRPEPGAQNLQWQDTEENKFCFPFDCEEFRELNNRRPAGRPIFDALEILKFDIRFNMEDPIFRGAINLQWDDLDTDDPFFVQGVLPGTYCYTITSPCCSDVIQGCIELCPDLIEGEWNIDEENGEACRQLTCPPSGLLEDTNSQDKSDEITYTQCVPLAYGPYSFDSSTKTCRRAVIISTTEEVVSFEEKPSTSIERYDEQSGNCVREYFCDDSEVSEDVEYGFPQFGNWQFDQANTICYREVTCFGTSLPNQRDSKEPTYDWSYNNFTGNCEGVVLCDGSPVFGSQVLTQFPTGYGFWTYNTFSKKCVRTVNCAFGLDGEAEQEKEPTYQYSYDANTGWCSRQAICDGFPVAGAVETIFPSSFSQWNVQLAGTSCTRTVRCEHSSGSWIEQTVDATFTNGVDSPFCPDSKLFYLVCDGDVTNEYVCGVAKPGGKEDPKGKSLNSDVILLQEEVYPNPFRNEIVITLLPEMDIQVEIMLKDINMRTVRADEFELVKGLNRIHFNTGTVKPGAFSLLIINKTTGELLSTQKVIKQ